MNIQAILGLTGLAVAGLSTGGYFLYDNFFITSVGQYPTYRKLKSDLGESVSVFYSCVARMGHLYLDSDEGISDDASESIWQYYGDVKTQILKLEDGKKKFEEIKSHCRKNLIDDSLKEKKKLMKKYKDNRWYPILQPLEYGGGGLHHDAFLELEHEFFGWEVLDTLGLGLSGNWNRKSVYEVLDGPDAQKYAKYEYQEKDFS